MGPPDTCLGAQIGKTQLPNGFSAWHTEADECVKNGIKVVQKPLDDDSNGLQTEQAKTPHPSGHKPELDVNEKLDDAIISRFQQLIGILRWAMELGHVEMHLKVLVSSQYLASPRQGHLKMACHVFACLKAHPQVKLVFDPTEPYIDESWFQKVDWTKAHGDIVEELPTRCPTSCSNSVIVSCVIDADHAGNHVTWRSHTGVFNLCEQCSHPISLKPAEHS